MGGILQKLMRQAARGDNGTDNKHFVTLDVYKDIAFWLTSSDMAKRLDEIDQKIAQTPSKDIPALWDDVPFDLFSLLTFHRPTRYPNIRAFLPDWPPIDLQENTVGASGRKLMMMTNAFIRSMTSGAATHLDKPLREANVLDYGVGFGRNIRMLSKYVPADQLFGVDVLDSHVELCRTLGVKATTAVCDKVPSTLPEPMRGVRFDLAFLFSIFTHLSESTHQQVLDVLHRNLDDNGLLVVTIRPGESWDVVLPHESEAYKAKHATDGFSFLPLEILPPVNGEQTFGETSISLDYIGKAWSDWKVIASDLNVIDPYQLIVFLKKR